MRATRLIWDLAGSPTPTMPLDAVTGVCAVCDTPSDTTGRVDKVLGANFGDRGHIKTGTDRICPACAWCCSGRPPATLRMWSVIAAPGTSLPGSHPKAWIQDTPGLCLLNRANPGPVAAILAAPPESEWAVTVAYSGQKHVVPYADTNHGPGQWTIRVEDHYVTATPALWRDVHTAAMTLRRFGVPNDAVRIGEPRNIKTGDTLAEWRRHATVLDPYLTSPLLDLALWTITKETMQ